VAIIKSINYDKNPPTITIIEANYGTNDGQHVPTREIPYDPATNTVQQTGSCPVQGWVHPEGDNSLVNAPPGQPGNYIPQNQMPAGNPGGGTTGGGNPGGGATGGGAPAAATPGVNPQQFGYQPGVNPGGQMQGGIPQMFADNQVGGGSPQEIAQLILGAMQEVMQGNNNGPCVNKLYEWYMQQVQTQQGQMGQMQGINPMMQGMNPMMPGQMGQMQGQFGMNPMMQGQQGQMQQDPIMQMAANILIMAGKPIPMMPGMDQSMGGMQQGVMPGMMPGMQPPMFPGQQMI
jgi:hypothetical protein